MRTHESKTEASTVLMTRLSPAASKTIRVRLGALRVLGGVAGSRIHKVGVSRASLYLASSSLVPRKRRICSYRLKSITSRAVSKPNWGMAFKGGPRNNVVSILPISPAIARSCLRSSAASNSSCR